MLTLTRLHRQALATLAVLVLFIAPTGYFAYWAWAVRRPEHLRRVEGELSAALGLAVALGRVSYPRPGEMRLDRVALRPADAPSAGSRPADLLWAESLRLVRHPGQMTIEADGLTIRAERPSQVVAQVVALLGRAGGEGRAISFLAPSCAIEPGAGRPRAAAARAGEDAADLLPAAVVPPLRPAGSEASFTTFPGRSVSVRSPSGAPAPGGSVVDVVAPSAGVVLVDVVVVAMPPV